MRWDWENDGAWDTGYSTTKTASHQYSTEDTKTITFEVKDTAGLTATTTRLVYVGTVDYGEMVLIPAGEFSMGSNNGRDREKPVHTVYLDAYYMDKYEVTNGQYKAFCDATGRSYPRDPVSDYLFNYPNYPVVYVSWNDAKAYAEWAGKRLPTEAEWEKAARGGLEGKTYPWGDEDPGTHCNWYGYTGSLTSQMPDFFSNRGPLPVSSFEANGYGLSGMAGNVSEWVNDWYDGNYYANGPSNNPPGPDTDSFLVLRGGGWYYNANYLRVAYRCYSSPTRRNYVIGFRCVR